MLGRMYHEYDLRQQLEAVKLDCLRLKYDVLIAEMSFTIKALLAHELEKQLADDAAKAGFNPNQPRVPRGQTGAGQWTRGEGNPKPENPSKPEILSEPLVPPYDPPIEPIYPIETVIGLLGGTSILRGTAFLLRRITDVNAKTLSASQFNNLQRFDKKLPKDAGEIQILRGQNNQRIFRADVPAKNIPGSFARYEKVVDKLGNTVSYTKTTYAPDGRIIHTKIK